MAETSDLELALAMIRARQPRYELYSRYYDGDHRLVFATDKFRNTFGALFREFADNLCPVVVSAVADRLTVARFETEIARQARQVLKPGDPQPEDPAEAAAWAIWQANRMDQQAGQVHLEALKEGDSYVLVWPDPSGEPGLPPRLYPQRARQMIAYYDEEDPGVIRWAAKVWVTSEKQVRLNLYYADRIEKYQTKSSGSSSLSEAILPEKAGSFEEFRGPRDEAWPVTNPWGRVPVFHFANDAGVGDPGVSELKNVIPLQDALNKSVLDMMVGAEFVSLPQRWATGLEVDNDPVTGKAKQPFQSAVDRLWVVADDKAQFGQFQAADLTQFLKIQDGFRMEMARVSGTPLHYFNLLSGQLPSGEALKTLESRLIKKTKDRMVSYGNTWEDVMSFALIIAGQELASRLSTEWEDPAPIGDKERAETVEIKKGIGVSKRQCLIELGYSEDKVDEMLAEAQEEADTKVERDLAAFNRGAGFNNAGVGSQNA